MTGFKITEEDVGRVAVDFTDNEIEIVFVDENNAVGRWKDGTNALVIYGTDGYQSDAPDLTHWKPRLLEAEPRWWNLYRNRRGEIVTFDYDTFAEAADVPPENEPIARIHAPHWHGCEEGRFDEPDYLGCKCGVRAIPGGGGAYDPHENPEDCDTWFDEEPVS